jgi:predicted pyridoxine 5'-phosphate oxidase superfamily flavin-nucleotide-binding protein
MLLATTDENGWPVASIVTGPAGFVSSPEIDALMIDNDAHWLNGVQSLLGPGKPVGMLGIDLSTRRRNRVNGIVSHIDEAGMHLDVAQSFGNCPKYIQVRDIDGDATATPPSLPAPIFTELDDKARAMIAAADTFFVATSSGPNAVTEGGLDISHKGGRPGFIRIDGNMLTIPDFVGNRYFNTFGNMLVDPRAAILLVDFASGDVLHLQGTSEVLWNSDEAQQLTGAQRLWRFHVQRGVRMERAVGLRWSLKEFAPTTEATGVWQDAESIAI